MAETPKKKIRWSAAWQEARALIWARRWRLTLGLVLMLVNRSPAWCCRWSTKYFIDDVDRQAPDATLLPPLALVVGGATIVQAITSFALSQVLGVAAQRAITDMRRRVEEHVMRLPVRYFDTTQTGVLISRIMNDAEGIRNLVGTASCSWSAASSTAVVALGLLLLPELAADAGHDLVVLGGVRRRDGYAFKTLRPLFRERGKINAEVTGRLNQALGGVRIVKTYTAEKREDLVFTKGVHKLLRNIAQVDDRRVGDQRASRASSIGAIGVITIIVGGRAIVAGTMTRRRSACSYIVVHGLAGDADRPDRVDRHADHARRSPASIASARFSTRAREDADDASRGAARRLARRHRVRGRLVRVQPGRAGAEGRVVPRAGRARRRRWSDRPARARAR